MFPSWTSRARRGLGALAFALAAAAVSGCFEDLSRVGEKGDTIFAYECIGHDAACSDNRGSMPTAFPSPIAVGSVFLVHVNASDFDEVGHGRPISASEDFLVPSEEDGELGLRATGAGEVGVADFIVRDTSILDVIHLRLAEPDAITVDCEGLAVKDGTLVLPLGTTARCWLTPRKASGDALAGTMRGTWSYADPSVESPSAVAWNGAGVRITGKAKINEVSIVGAAAGTTVFAIAMGERTLSLKVEVTP
jgi:hypothetical protein